MLTRLPQADLLDSLLRANSSTARDKWNLRCNHFPKRIARSGQSDSDHHFFHTNVFLRHASGASGEADEHIDRILTQAAVLKRRVWVSSLLFAELRPSMFVPGRFGTLQELARYIRSLATLVTPDPNTMLRVARLRDAKWQRAAGVRGDDEKPRMMSFSDAVQIASALWVKEAGGVADLKFLMFDDWSSNEAKRGAPLSLLRLQDYADGCASQFGRDGGREVDAHPALSPDALDSTTASAAQSPAQFPEPHADKTSRRPRR